MIEPVEIFHGTAGNYWGEEMAPGSRVEDITEPAGSWQAQRLLTSSSRTFTGTSLC